MTQRCSTWSTDSQRSGDSAEQFWMIAFLCRPPLCYSKDCCLAQSSLSVSAPLVAAVCSQIVACDRRRRASRGGCAAGSLLAEAPLWRDAVESRGLRSQVENQGEQTERALRQNHEELERLAASIEASRRDQQELASTFRSLAGLLRGLFFAILFLLVAVTAMCALILFRMSHA